MACRAWAWTVKRGIAAAGVGLVALHAIVLPPVARADERPEFTMSIVSAMTKLRRDEHGPVRAAPEVRLTAARGEAESMQLVIQADGPLAGMTVTAAPLAGPGDATLPLELLLVGYVPITHPTPVGFGRTGPYPDPLLPMRPFDVAAGESQSIWVTCWVPRDAVPGDYKGSITVQPRGAGPREVPVVVKVSPIQLPVVPALRTSFDYWVAGGNPQWYGAEDWKTREARFLDDLLRYRITTPPRLPWADVFTKAADGTWQATWESFDRAVEAALAKGSAFFMIRRQIFAWYGAVVPAELPDREVIAAKLRLLDTHLAEKGWADRFAFYLFDEPNLAADAPKRDAADGPTNVKSVQAIAAFLHENAPHLRLMIVACDPAYESVAIDKPAYVWCPHINHFNADFQAKRQQMGEPNWMYVCITTWKSNFPDMWRIDRPGTSHRAVGSWLWRYQCDGFLFWCVDFWRKNPFEIPDIYAEGANGDGFLFYPDPKKQDDPYPSIRAALMRDGFEDFELLALARTAAKAVMAEGPKLPPARQGPAVKWLTAARQAMSVEDVIPEAQRFADAALPYENRHRQLLTLLERFEKDANLRRMRDAAAAGAP